MNDDTGDVDVGGSFEQLVKSPSRARDGKFAKYVQWTCVGGPRRGAESVQCGGVDDHRELSGFVVGQSSDAKSSSEFA